MGKDSSRSDPQEIPPILIRFAEWVRQNWFLVALVIALFVLIIGMLWVARRR